MSKKKLPLSLLMIRGAIGRSFVIKHYKFGIFMTKFPDMTRIVASKKQRICRNLFKEAVAYAKTVIADEARKKEWQKRLKRSKRVYHAAIKEFMIKEKKKLLQAGQIQTMISEKKLHHPNPSVLTLMDKCIYKNIFLVPRICDPLSLQKMIFFETG